MVGNIIDMPFSVVAPTVVGATNRVTLNVLTADFSDNQHGAGVLRQVRTHVLAVGIQHHRIATLASIEREVTAEKSNANGPVIDLTALSHDEPPAWVGVGS